MNSNHAIAEAADYIKQARSILFVTGAGISVDSGLPTYRGPGGLYDGTMTPDGIPIEEVLSGRTLQKNPALTWKYLWEIASAVRGKKPNRGHEIIAELQKEKPDSWVLTQNVDGLHADAGTENLIEIHGRARRLVCTKCDAAFDDGEAVLWSNAVTEPNPPECPRCDSILRPDVVLFGEMLDLENVSLLENLMSVRIEAVVSVGTSSQFPYIMAPMEVAYSNGIPTIEINTEETAVSQWAACRVEAPCTEALVQIRARLAA